MSQSTNSLLQLAFLSLSFLLASDLRAQAVCGDCNSDGQVATIIDALTAAQVSAMIVTPSAIQLCSCDVNTISGVTIVDALILAQASAMLPVALMCPMIVCGGGGGGAAPTVDITNPTSGTHMGVVTVTLNANDTDLDPLVVIFDFSTNAGASYSACATSGAGTIATNPAVGVAVPVTGGTFAWSTLGDSIGLTGPQAVILRVSVSDGTLNDSDSEMLTINNMGAPMGCTSVACAGNVPGTSGPGTMGFPPPVFTSGATGDTRFFVANVSGRTPGQSAVITLNNLSDDHDLYVGNVGTPCGSTNPALYMPTPGLVGVNPESIVLSDAQLTSFGNMVPIAIYHYDPNPTGNFNVNVNCVTPGGTTCTNISCGGTLPGVTGPGTGLILPPVFTVGPSGDSQPFRLSVASRPAGSVVRVTVTNISDDVDLFVPISTAIMCADTMGANWNYSASGGLIGLGDEFHTFTDAEATAFGNMIPIWVYHYDPAPTATFNVNVSCFIPSGCSGTVEQTLNQPTLPIVINGNTAGGDDTASVGCGTGGDPGDIDHIIEFIPASTGTFTFTLCGGTTNFDTILGIRSGDCAFGPEIACNDDTCALISTTPSVPMTAGQSYFVVIDGWGSETGLYTLSISTP